MIKVSYKGFTTTKLGIYKLNCKYYTKIGISRGNYTVQKIRGTCFWNVCHAPQNNTAFPDTLSTKPLFFTVEIYKRTLMDSRSFSEHKQKCPNWSENKVITVHQGGSISLLESFSMVYVLHEHLSQLGTYVVCSV